MCTKPLTWATKSPSFSWMAANFSSKFKPNSTAKGSKATHVGHQVAVLLVGDGVGVEQAVVEALHQAKPRLLGLNAAQAA